MITGTIDSPPALVSGVVFSMPGTNEITDANYV